MAFFSGTDVQEMLDNVDNYPYYLSLIVNNSGEYCARIAFVAEEIGVQGLKVKVGLNCPDNIIELGDSKSNKTMVYMDCIIKWEYNVPDAFREKITELIEAKNKRTYVQPYTRPGGSGQIGFQFEEKERKKTGEQWTKEEKEEDKVFISEHNVSLSICKLVTLDLKYYEKDIDYLLKVENAKFAKYSEKSKVAFVDSMEDMYEDILDKCFNWSSRPLNDFEIRKISKAIVQKLDAPVYKDYSLVHKIIDVISTYLIDEEPLEDAEEIPSLKDATNSKIYHENIQEFYDKDLLN